ncbi:FeoA family protein [Methanococcus voltae]|jgi:ferrous iron transport protein A|uniref:Ferrous iron transport protein A n=2 Tax=Methanococcus voltae TaxID=2188 RepID=A0A8J7RHQ4_METVO|nr:FeoA family protein [Methanococcus voltae]MBP2173136.1 ferrous iron transport protein A [Methanococcus voltae]MBP2202072.1 ferrous iron transport protein A [Methanococcus voltae]MCS3922839.1 ferrous iron transport protein A [Methanococcus voltae PS]
MESILSKNPGSYTVLEVNGGACRKFYELGIIPGCKLTVLNKSQGPLLVRIGNSKIAIGRGMADKILVK